MAKTEKVVYSVPSFNCCFDFSEPCISGALGSRFFALAKEGEEPRSKFPLSIIYFSRYKMVKNLHQYFRIACGYNIRLDISYFNKKNHILSGSHSSQPCGFRAAFSQFTAENSIFYSHQGFCFSAQNLLVSLDPGARVLRPL